MVYYYKKDVEITRELFFYGVKNNYLIFHKKDKGLLRIPVEWDVEHLL